jgi:hypothetical protein
MRECGSPGPLRMPSSLPALPLSDIAGHRPMPASSPAEHCKFFFCTALSDSPRNHFSAFAYFIIIVREESVYHFCSRFINNYLINATNTGTDASACAGLFCYCFCRFRSETLASIEMPWFSKKSYILQSSLFFYFLSFHFKTADIINN